MTPAQVRNMHDWLLLVHDQDGLAYESVGATGAAVLLDAWPGHAVAGGERVALGAEAGAGSAIFQAHPSVTTPERTIARTNRCTRSW